MDPDPQSADLLKMALSGSEIDLAQVHELCQVRRTAEKLAQMLELTDSPVTDEVRSWAGALEEWHPGLKVYLPPPGGR